MFVHSLYHSRGYYYYFFLQDQTLQLEMCVYCFFCCKCWENFFVCNIVSKNVIYIFFSVDECKNTLIQFGVQDITPSSVARVIGMKN